MAGQDLEVDAPTDVPLEIEMQVCIKHGYFFEDVQQALLIVFSNRTQTDGRRGVFHPDNFTFAQDAYLSRIVAAAQAVEGVDAVRAEVFQRLIHPDPTTLDSAVIEIGALEIAQLANNPSFPERGRLVVHCGGGK